VQIGIDPVAFTIGPLSVRWYSLMIAVAVIFLVTWSLHFARKTGYQKDFILGVALWAIPLGIVGAKLIHIFDNLNHYLAFPGAILDPAGWAIFGAILGALLGVWLYCRSHNVPFAPLADAMAPGIILAQAIGRIGCTLNGCCYGAPSSLPWTVTWTHPDSEALVGVAVHPTQIYEILWDVLIFAILWFVLRGRLKAPGSLFAVYLALYSLGSFLIRSLRADVTAFAAGLNEGQVVALMVFIVAAGFLVSQYKKAGNFIHQNQADN